MEKNHVYELKVIRVRKKHKYVVRYSGLKVNPNPKRNDKALVRKCIRNDPIRTRGQLLKTMKTTSIVLFLRCVGHQRHEIPSRKEETYKTKIKTCLSLFSSA